MKLTYFKIIPFIVATFALLALNGCDGTTGISSDSGLDSAPVAQPPVTPPPEVTPPVTPTAPVAVDDDTNETAVRIATTLNVVENDTDVDGDINVSTVNFVHVDATDTDSDGDNDQLIVPGEGKWTVDEDGNVTFRPGPNVIGDPTPIFYTVSDNTGLESNEAKITIDYPQSVQSVSLTDLTTGYLVSGIGADLTNIYDFTSIEFCGDFATYAWVTDFGGGFPPSTIDYIIDVNDIIFGFGVLVETSLSGTPGTLNVGTSYVFPGPDVDFTITNIEPVVCIPAPI